jgi:hypothetical protein
LLAVELLTVPTDETLVDVVAVHQYSVHVYGVLLALVVVVTGDDELNAVPEGSEDVPLAGLVSEELLALEIVVPTDDELGEAVAVHQCSVQVYEALPEDVAGDVMEAELDVVDSPVTPALEVVVWSELVVELPYGPVLADDTTPELEGVVLPLVGPVPEGEVEMTLGDV